jgi:signal peptidase I
MSLDNPWQIATLIGAIAFLRIIYGLWREAPARAFGIELLDSGLIAFALVFLLIRPFVVQAFYIPTGSMEPTLMGHQGRPGDRILVNKFVYRLNSPRRGDVVVFVAPPQALHGDNSSDYIKRVIGLPGDEIRIKAYDGVYVNGKRLVEPYVKATPDYNWPADEFGRPLPQPYPVPAGQLLVLGDNRRDSNDSHRWENPENGAPQPGLPMRNVLGKAMAIFWPLNRIGLVR